MLNTGLPPLTLTLILSVHSVVQGNTDTTSSSRFTYKNDILPNPTKVYADQCYVWLKEMPQFFRERHYLPGGLYQGLAGIGTWHPVWPEDWKKPDIPDAYDSVVAHECTLDMPIK